MYNKIFRDEQFKKFQRNSKLCHEIISKLISCNDNKQNEQ